MSVLIKRLGMNPYLSVRQRRSGENFVTVYPIGMERTPHLKLLAEFIYTYYDNKLGVTNRVGSQGRMGIRVYY